MTLASGAHFKIDTFECMAAMEIEPHYNHDFQPLFANANAIAGEIAKDQLHPERIVWAISDFAGGEGSKIYYPQQPDRYDVASLMNVTQRGMLTTRTKRRRASVTGEASPTTTERPAGVSAYATAIIAWGSDIIASTDAITWDTTADVSPNLGGTSSHFADAITDGTNAAFLLATSSTTDVIPVVQADAGVTTWDDTHTGTAVDYPIVGCVIDGVPYTMSLATTFIIKKKAAVMDSAADWGATTVFNTNIVPAGTWGTDYWTSAVGAETASFWSYATKAQSFVWEVRNDVGRPYWTPPPGFVIKKLVYHLGVLFALGSRVAAGNAFASMYAIPLATRSPVFIAAPRKHRNVALDSLELGCPGPDSNLFVADTDSGKIFLYDLERDAISLFDDLANGGTGDSTDFVADDDKIGTMFMHGARLVVATYSPGESGTALQVISYDDLEVDNRDAGQAISATLETAEWDFGLPLELKALTGFYVTYKVTDSGTTSGLLANSRITVSYSADDATYVDTTVITSATTPTGAKGRVFIAAPTGSSTVKFTRLKIKITLDNNATAVAPPILFGVMVEAQPVAYKELWDLAIRVEDEAQNDRPTLRANVASYLRDALEDLVQNKNIVTFLDGLRYKFPHSSPQPGYSSHTVIVESVSDEIQDTLAEGVMRVRLRAVA